MKISMMTSPRFAVIEEKFNEIPLKETAHLDNESENTRWLLDNLERYFEDNSFINKCILGLFKNVKHEPSVWQSGYYRKKNFIGDIYTITKKRYTRKFMVIDCDNNYDSKNMTVKKTYYYMTVKNFILQQIYYEIEHTSWSFYQINMILERLLFEKWL